jgi:putative two-component system response regulator
MAVADVYDALMDTRVYRNGLGHTQTSEIIIESSGSHFDPRIVESFNAVHKELAEIAAANGEQV